MTVHFIGAGPGDPELITVKAQRIMKDCPIVLYAGSLVPREILSEVEDSAVKIADTAHMDLDEIMVDIEAAHAADQDVARVHSGDPMLYGAIGEQIRRLEQKGKYMTGQNRLKGSFSCRSTGWRKPTLEIYSFPPRKTSSRYILLWETYT